MNVIQSTIKKLASGQYTQVLNTYNQPFNPIELTKRLKSRYAIQVMKQNHNVNNVYDKLELSFIGQFETTQVFTKQGQMLTLFIVDETLAFVELKPHTFIIIELTGGQQ